MNQSFLRALLCLGCLLQWYAGSAQTTVTLPLSKDAYLVSSSSSSNFGNNGVFVAGSYNVDVAIFRSALQVDLSSIPNDAVITSAHLFLHKHTGYTTSGSSNFSLQRFISNWSEASISYSSQPEVDETTVDLLSNEDGLYVFDITADVSEMYSGTYDNYGWLLRGGDETANNSEEYFYSREYTNSGLRPYVEIIYTAPLKIENALINHSTSSSANDGTITPEVSGGSGNYTYNWVSGNSGTVIGTGASLVNLSSGWYGVHITDTGTSEELFMAFIVGDRSGEITVDFKPGADYTDDAMIYDLIRNGINYGDNNYGIYSLIRAENWTYGPWYDVKSTLKFNLWMDPSFSINQADLYLYGIDHYPLSRPNTSEFVKIIEDWEESEITYNTRPLTVADPLVTIPGTPQGNENKVIDMRPFWNEWSSNNTENYGAMLQLQLYNDQYTRMRFHSSDAVDSTNHPWMQFKLAIPTSVSWNDTTEMGSVQLDISSFSTTGPYHYIISRAPITDLSDTYDYLKDSLNMEVDSLKFFTGKSLLTSHVFNSVEAGTHFISVFDAAGDRIFDGEVDVYGDFALESSSVGLVARANTIRANLGETGAGSVELYTVQGDDVGLVVKFDEVSESPQYIGFANSNVQVDSYSDLEFGIYFDGVNVYTVQYGSLSEPFSVNFDIREAQLQIIGGMLVLKANQQLLVSQSLPTQYTYKLGVGLQNGALISILNFNLLPFLHRLPNYRFRPNVIRHLNCSDDQLGSISFSVSSFYSGSQFTYSISHEETSQLVSSGTLSFNTSLAPVGTFASSDPLIAGTYIVQYTIGTQVYTGEIDLGYEVDWAQRDQEYTETPNSYSLLISGHDEQSFLGARSTNTMRYNEAGWIEFTPVLANDDMFNMVRPTVLNLGNTPSSLAILTEEFVSFFKVSSFNNYYWSQLFSPSTGYSPYYSLNDNSRIRMEFTITGGSSNMGEILLFENGVEKAVVDRGNSSIIARFASILNNDGFKDVIVSFPCPEPSVMYGHLKYKLDGFYHIMDNGKIRFVFDQEYDSDNLKFNIYNQSDVLVRTEADFPPLSTVHGDNYLTIDVSDESTCIGRDFFYLEVINSKKEKMYLRFFNNDNSLICPGYDDNGGDQ